MAGDADRTQAGVTRGTSIDWGAELRALDPVARRVIEQLLAGATQAEICTALCLSPEAVTRARDRALAHMCRQLASCRCQTESSPNGGGGGRVPCGIRFLSLHMEDGCI